MSGVGRSTLTKSQRNALEAAARGEVVHDAAKFTFVLNGRGSMSLWFLWRTKLIAPGRKIDGTRVLMEPTELGRIELSPTCAPPKTASGRDNPIRRAP